MKKAKIVTYVLCIMLVCLIGCTEESPQTGGSIYGEPQAEVGGNASPYNGSANSSQNYSTTAGSNFSPLGSAGQTATGTFPIKGESGSSDSVNEPGTSTTPQNDINLDESYSDSNGTSRFTSALELPPCSDRIPETIVDEIEVRSLAMYGDTLVLGAKDGIYTMPKDTSTPPVEIEGSDAANSVTVFGDFIYRETGEWIKSYPVPGFTGYGVDEAYDIRARDIDSDGTSLYIGGSHIYCESEVHVFTLDGEHRELLGNCVQRVAGRNGTVYAVDETDDTVSIVKAGPQDQSFQIVVTDPNIDDEPITTTDQYLYFVMKDSNGIDDRYLARLPLSGTEIEILTGPMQFETVWSDGESVFFYGTFTPHNCPYRYHEPTGVIESIASYGDVLTADETYYYSISSRFPGGSAMRISR